MTKQFLLSALLAVVGLSVLVACSEAQTNALHTMAARPIDGQAVAMSPETPEETATATPGFSMLATSTLDPIANGPLGTWTAIALTIAPPTPDPNQYEIVNRGNPHFIEFHAWW